MRLSTFSYTTKRTEIYLIALHWSWVFGLLFLVCTCAFAQISPKLSVSEIDKQVKLFLDPVKGLNSEIRTGLQKIEQTCNIIAKSKLDETKKLASNSSDPQSGAMRSEIFSAKQLAMDQNEALNRYILETRFKLAPQSKSCEGIASLLKTSDACLSYRANNEAVNHVADAGAYYYGEALGRLSSYESAYELEQKGCTRPGFSNRLWAAEQMHLLPTMKTSAQTLFELLR